MSVGTINLNSLETILDQIDRTSDLTIANVVTYLPNQHAAFEENASQLSPRLRLICRGRFHCLDTQPQGGDERMAALQEHKQTQVTLL